MKVRDYLEQEGMTLEELTGRLGELGVAKRRGASKGEPYTVDDVSHYTDMPRSWAKALEVDGTGGGEDASQRAQEGLRAPRMPAGAPLAPKPPILADVARDRISALYETAGYAGSIVLEAPGVRVVTDDYAPHIASAWVKAAEENEFAARVVRLMSSGGAVGELVTCHLLWLLGIVYVTGRVDDPTGLLARKYRPYHDAAVAASRAQTNGDTGAAGYGQVADQDRPVAGAGDAVGEPGITTPV